MFEEREGRWRGWMIAAQAGDAAAYEKLLLELLPHLRGFVRRRIGDSYFINSRFKEKSYL